MDLSSGFAGITEAIKIASSLRSIEKSYDSATYKAQIAELISSLLDSKLALSEANEKVSELEVEIVRLKKGFESQGELKSHHGYKYFGSKHGIPVGYPICPRCESVDGRIIEIKRHEAIWIARCPICATEYNPVQFYEYR